MYFTTGRLFVGEEELGGGVRQRQISNVNVLQMPARRTAFAFEPNQAVRLRQHQRAHCLCPRGWDDVEIAAHRIEVPLPSVIEEVD